MGGKGRARSEERENFWRRIVERQPASGLSIGRWCDRHCVSEPSFYAWRRELARRDAERRVATAPTGFVAVEVSDTPRRAGSGAAIQVVLGEVRIEVGPDFDDDTLRRLMALVRSATPGAAAC